MDCLTPVELRRTLNLDEMKIRENEELNPYTFKLLPKNITEKKYPKNSQKYKDYITSSINSTIFLVDKWNEL